MYLIITRHFIFSPSLPASPLLNTAMAATTLIETAAHMVLHHETDTIIFRDSSTGVDIYIDGSGVDDVGVEPQSEDAIQEQKDVVVDLCQHYLLHHIDKNNFADCRELNYLLKEDNIATLTSIVAEMHIKALDGVEDGLRATHRLLGRMVSMLEQRILARKKMKVTRLKKQVEELENCET